MNRVKTVLYVMTALLSSSGYAQRIIEMPVVLQLPEMADVGIENFMYRTADDTTLRADIYYPPGFDGESRLPLVILNNGVGSPSLPDWRVYQDWAKLVAVNGLIAMNYQSRYSTPMQDTEALIDQVREKANDLKIDADRMGVWTCSGNAQVGMPLVMQHDREYIRCAVVYYGMPDTIRAVRQDLPIQVVRAGLDLYQLNKNIDAFVARALAEDLDIELINYVAGRHAFDILDDTDRSRHIIQQTLSFLKANLNREYDRETGFVLTARNFQTLMRNDDIERAERLFREAAQQNTNSHFYRVTAEYGTNEIGFELLDEKEIKAAISVFNLVIETYPERPLAYEGLAAAYEADNRKELALANSRKALALVDKATRLDETEKQRIQAEATARIERLQ